MHVCNVFTPYTSVLYCTKLNHFLYAFLKVLGREERSHVEGAEQDSQQEDAAKLLIDFSSLKCGCRLAMDNTGA